VPPLGQFVFVKAPCWLTLQTCHSIPSVPSMPTHQILRRRPVADLVGVTAIFLTFWHMTFSAVATQILARTTRLLDGRRNVEMTGRIYLRIIVPIGLFYTGSLVCSNLTYLYISVAFIQMLKVGLSRPTLLQATLNRALLKRTSTSSPYLPSQFSSPAGSGALQVHLGQSSSKSSSSSAASHWPASARFSFDGSVSGARWVQLYSKQSVWS
jgi:hypothetical protein